MIKRKRLVKSFCDLVKIDSPSGQEDKIAEYLSEKLTQLGFEVDNDDYGNIVAKEEGNNPLMLSAHMDTVEPGRNINPKVEGDIIKSDGTTILGGDCKAGIAAILEGVESSIENNQKNVIKANPFKVKSRPFYYLYESYYKKKLNHFRNINNF